MLEAFTREACLSTTSAAALIDADPTPLPPLVDDVVVALWIESFGDDLRDAVAVEVNLIHEVALLRLFSGGAVEPRQRGFEAAALRLEDHEEVIRDSYILPRLVLHAEAADKLGAAVAVKVGRRQVNDLQLFDECRAQAVLRVGRACERERRRALGVRGRASRTRLVTDGRGADGERPHLSAES